MKADLDGHARRLLREEQVRLIVDQVRRMPPMHFGTDVGLTIVAWRAGVLEAALVWLTVITICQTSRSIYVSRLHRAGTLAAFPERMLSRMAGLQMLQGGVHSVIIVIVFMAGDTTAQYVVSLIMLGVAAGAISTAAGHLPTYLSWACLFGAVLAGAWLSTGTVEGVVLAVLLVALIVLFALHVRDQGRSLATLVGLTETLRVARDRAEMERARAQAASEARTRFFAAASHDLRQPLHAMGINVATVRVLARQNQDPILARVGEVTYQALEESRSLLDSLLEISKLDAGAVQPEFATVDVGAVLRSVQQTCTGIAEEKGLALVCDEASRPPLLAHADAALLKRMVLNLVGNAIKFTTAGQVSLHARSEDDAVIVGVQDTGPGIPAGEQEKVFEEFYQLGNAERDRSRGLGLGLAIVRRVAALCNAQVALRSGAGQGCLFEIRLAAASAAAATSSPLPDENNAGAEAAGRIALAAHRYRVLIVDDEREIRESLETFLEVLGWSPRAVSSEHEALALVREGWRPDALVLDFRLRRGRSGLQALEQLREMGCAAPAILVTGDTAPERIEAARAAGLPLFYKPVDGLGLARCIAGVIQGESKAASTDASPMRS